MWRLEESPLLITHTHTHTRQTGDPGTLTLVSIWRVLYGRSLQLSKLFESLGPMTTGLIYLSVGVCIFWVLMGCCWISRVVLRTEQSSNYTDTGHPSVFKPTERLRLQLINYLWHASQATSTRIWLQKTKTKKPHMFLNVFWTFVHLKTF